MSTEQPRRHQYSNFRPTGDEVREGKKSEPRYANFRPTPDPVPDQESDSGGEFKCRGKGCTRSFKVAAHLGKHEKSCEKAQAASTNE